MIEKIYNLINLDDNIKTEITETYTDTWGNIVKQLVLKRFVSGDAIILSLSPDFENIESVELIVDGEEGVD